MKKELRLTMAITNAGLNAKPKFSALKSHTNFSQDLCSQLKQTVTKK